MKIELDKEKKTIIEFVAQHPDSISNQRRFDSIIADCIPENKALRNALSIAYEEGVINILRVGTDSQQTMYRCRKLLENNGGLRPELAISAVLVMAYICGKQEWFQDEPQTQNTELTSINQKSKIKRFKSGQLEYVEVEDGIILTKVDFSYNGLRPSKTAIAIPEKINEISVVGVMPNAFNQVRKSRCKIILLPQTVTTVGRQETRLYESFHEKGVFAKPIIYLARKLYSDYENASDFYKVLTAFDQEDFFGFETSLDNMETYGFIPLKRYQDENEYWRYPEDELWVCDGYLDRYSGTEELLQINGLRGIGADAFVNLPIREIIFGETVTHFSTNMIHDCNRLEKIVIKAGKPRAGSRCYFHPRAIHHCEMLSDLEWPWNMTFEQLSIYDHCPKLGDCIRWRRLLTCQKQDEVLFLDKELERVNNRAFVSCDNLRILIVPESMEKLEYDALSGSKIDIIIFEGKHTQWEVHSHDYMHLYVFCKKDSNVKDAISPFKPQPLVHVKNITSIESFIELLDYEGLKKYCYAVMDERSDEDMVSKPYDW